MAFRTIGKALPRIEGEGKVTGQTKYAADLPFEDLLWAKVLRASVPHASYAQASVGLRLRQATSTSPFWAASFSADGESSVRAEERGVRDVAAVLDVLLPLGRDLPDQVSGGEDEVDLGLVQGAWLDALGFHDHHHYY